jgi:hypothetical protein
LSPPPVNRGEAPIQTSLSERFPSGPGSTLTVVFGKVMPISERVEAMTMPLLIAIVTETSKKNSTEFRSKINSVVF